MRCVLAWAIVLASVSSAMAQKEFGFDNRKASGQPYLTPAETVAKFEVVPEFEVKLFAGEPLLANPIAFSIDERGRTWAIECFEYPNRTPKDRSPRDRIVILEDTDGDGTADKRTIFAEGKDFPEHFDMASGLEVGHGGVFVGAPPYLWYIENKNDKPGKFEILAKGFGSQDTHETLNTFQWGPDGWLYGLHGVFTQSNVKPLDGPEVRMNAAVWRLHPKTRKFEIYAEGTSNPWGMDWRNSDGQFILACCVIPHLYHIVPGGIYKRQAGTSYNPYAYGFIKEISDHTFHKESGWAHAGLLALDAPHIPEKYRNSVIFGSIHGCSLKQNILTPKGSSFLATRGDDFLVSKDKNVRPINLKWGPQGDIYLIDWHDQNPCHQAKAEDWDYERGRIYRIQLKGTTPKKPDDLGKLSVPELYEALHDAEPYRYRTALRLLQELPLQTAREHFPKMPKPEQMQRLMWLAACSPATKLTGMRFDADTPLSAEQWALVASQIRMIRNVAELPENTIELLTKAVSLPNAPPTIRRELASVAIALGDKFDTAPLLRALMSNKADANDALIPHLTWIAYEKIISKKEGASNAPAEKEIDWLMENTAGNEFVAKQIVPKVMRRLVATGQPGDMTLCLKYIGQVSDLTARRGALEAFAGALQGQQVDAPKGWPETQKRLLAEKNPDVNKLVFQLAVNFRDPAAHKRAAAVVMSAKKSDADRIEAIKQVSLIRNPDAVKLLLELLKSDASETVRVEAVRGLSGFNDQAVPTNFIINWASYSPAVRAEAVNILAGRKEWAAALLSAIKEEAIERTSITDNTITKIQAFNDRTLNNLIESAWGRTRATPDELNKLIDKTRLDMAQNTGSIVRGQKVFEAQCAKCHKFEGKGNEVGPQLDGAGRDLEYLLVNILDPNRVIGAPYFVRQVNTADGQVIQGVLAEEDDRILTLKVENGVLKKILKADIDGPVKVLEKSMMPEGLGYNMTPQDFRDLVCYVMASPFFTEWTANGQALKAGVNGYLPLPAGAEKPIVLETSFKALQAMKTELLFSSSSPFELIVDGKSIMKGAATGKTISPDMTKTPLELGAGKHTIALKFAPGTKGAIYARLLDPERKLRFTE